ncbi:PEP-CTERM system TPR-repeat protein PrsT [Psychrosphaera sp. B3R10]|uniref:XrtA/PEP-CTERM system TPR-repeat protein PrsT n=1 Tax=unclassified Psychrosphaera TaxID=2641570 RepID=UPI001C09358E|nr:MULTISPECIES: XrtA/PEP-CTERM system TPR-repeat protein PrsT [unclassified Psychrosphaera]MBU2883733.1 PEP-CTERM system TPR-repeat protein PrsT [Psychrosphaera sp. I2R16]MBU2987965.1 PEP-CTERM system TPR-repeat protein PrsT [Psychrosphaera sp. B3R10]
MNSSRLLLVSTIIIALAGCGGTSPEEYFKLAQQHIQNGDSESAIIALKNVIKEVPGNIEARKQLAELYMADGSLDNAEKELAYVINKGQGTEKHYSDLLKVHNLLSDFESTLFIEGPEEWQDINLQSAFLYHKAMANYRLKNEELGKQTLEVLVTLAPETIYGKLASAYLMSEQDLMESANIIEALSQQFPNNSDIFMLKGLVLGSLKKYGEAAKAYEHHLTLMPKYRQIRLYIADALVKDKQFSAAQVHTEYLLKYTHEQAFLNQLQGVIKFDAKEYKVAQGHFEKAIQNGIDSTTNRLMAGLTSFQNKQYEKAYQYLSSIADKMPPTHPAKKILAITQLQLGYTLEASATMLELEGLNDADASMFASASFELIKDGDFKTAKTLLAKTENIDGKSASALITHGLAKLSLDDVSGVVNLEQALEIAPDLSVAKSALASAYMATNEFDKALKLAKTWQEQNDINGYNLAGYVYQKQGKAELATKAFEDALKLDSTNTPSHMYFANVNMKQGNYQEASSYLTKLFQKEPDNLTALKMYYFIGREQGNTKEALDLMEDRFKVNLTSEPHRLQLAQLYLNEKKPNQVIRILTSYDFQPTQDTNEFYWLALADSLQVVGKNNEALKLYSRWTQANPTAELAWLKKISAEQGLKRFALALTSVENALIHFPDSKGLQIVHVNLLIRDGQNDTAEGLLRRYFKDESKNLVVQYLQGQILLNRKNYKQSLPLLQAYYDKKQTSESARYIYAAYVGKGEKPKAIKFVESHIEKAPDDISNIYMLANEFLTTDNKKAQLYFGKMLSITPTNLVALNNLAWLQYQNDQLPEAKVTIERAFKINDNLPQLLDTGAIIYEKLGDIKKAKALINKAYKLTDDQRSLRTNYNRINAL